VNTGEEIENGGLCEVRKGAKLKIASFERKYGKSCELCEKIEGKFAFL
jgi:hypothetical protein